MYMSQVVVCMSMDVKNTKFKKCEMLLLHQTSLHCYLFIILVGTLLQYLILKVLATRPRVAYAAKFRAMNMKHMNKTKILNCSCLFIFLLYTLWAPPHHPGHGHSEVTLKRGVFFKRFNTVTKQD